MKLLVGLGNPGISYERTRHNAGALFLQKLQLDNCLPNWRLEKKFKALVSRGFWGKTESLLLLPQTFMNLSGESVAAALNFYRLQAENDLVLIYDDLDLEFGRFKIGRQAPHGHNGIKSVEEKLKTTDFLQARIGVDARGEERKISGMDYVLQVFSAVELQRLREEIFSQVETELEQKWL